MYQALLTRRYLTTKLMPFLAVAAVMLCCTTVIVSWSVMGGFLKLLLEAGPRIVGDVVIQWPTIGFAHYDDLIERLDEDPRVAASTPMIESFGVITLPDNRVKAVQIRGIEPLSYAKVTAYIDSIYWKPLDKAVPKDKEHLDPRLGEVHFFATLANYWSRLDLGMFRRFDLDQYQLADQKIMERLYHEALTLKRVNPQTGRAEPGMVLGVEVAGFAKRTQGGFYQPHMEVGTRKPDGDVEWMPGFLPLHHAVLSVLPMDKRGRAVEMASVRLPIVNEVQTGMNENDQGMVLVPLTELQRLLKMDRAERVVMPADPYKVWTDPDGTEHFGTPEVVDVEEARVTTVLVKAAPGVSAEELRTRCIEIWREFALVHRDVPPVAGDGGGGGVTVTTYERLQAGLVEIVKKETSLVLFILGIVSLTCTFLILAIFWGMVSEKTKDIGVLRSMGASWWGTAWLWIRYGLIIGLIGSALGGILGTTIVWNINPIHEWLGQQFGIVIWDPAVYVFPEIPHQIDPTKLTIVLSCGVLFSVLGAIIPAVRAASMNPVAALRFE